MYLLAYPWSGSLVVAFTSGERLGAEVQVWLPVLSIGLVGLLASKLSERAYRVLQAVIGVAVLVAVAVEPTSTVVLYATALVAAVTSVRWHRKRRKKGSGKSTSHRRR